MTAALRKNDEVSAPFAAQLEAAARSAAPFWLREARAAAASRFLALGLPGPHVESWKYTSLKGLEASPPAPARALDGAAPAANAAMPPADRARDRLTLVDGVFRPDLSVLPAALPARAFIGGWAQLIAENEALAQRIFARIASQDDAMAALNTALASDGAVVYLPAGARLAKPLELLSLAHGGSVHSRLTVVLEMGATATLIERHRAMREGFSNILSEIAVGDSAQLRHLRIQEASEGATHVATQAVRLGRDAHYRSLSLMMGAEVARHQVTVRLDAPGAEAQIDGLLLLRGHLHGDMTSVVEHAAPHGTSKQMVRAVLEDRAHGVFQGKIVVHEGAAKSDGAQLSNTLLLTHGTRMDVKPELEIFADDVQCSHGATTGAIDEAALFYLRSRGIPEGAARALLVQSFVSALIERLDDAALLATLEPQIAAWMGGAWAANPEGAP